MGKDLQNELAYECAVDDFLTGHIEWLPNYFIFNMIEKFWLSPLENYSVLDLQERREQSKHHKREQTVF